MTTHHGIGRAAWRLALTGLTTALVAGCGSGGGDDDPDDVALPSDAPDACATGVLGIVNHGELTGEDPVFGEPYGHYDIWCVHPDPGRNVIAALDVDPITGEPWVAEGQAAELALLVFDGHGDLVAQGDEVVAFDGTRDLTLRVVVAGRDAAISGSYHLHLSEGGPTSPTAVRPELDKRLRGPTTMGLSGPTATIPAETPNITNRTGENPTTATWDGKVIVRRCPDPLWDPKDYAEDPTPTQPGVVSGQYWCFHTFRAGEVAVDPGTGVPDFSNAFGPGYMSTDRHVSHTGGFPVIPYPSPAGRTNPYRSFPDGTPCGTASREVTPPPCPVPGVEAEGVLVTYDVYIVHTAGGSNPRFDVEYPAGAPAGATFFERMQIVVVHPETPEASVIDVIRSEDPFPMAVDETGFGYRDPDDPDERNPYLFRVAGDSATYIGGGAIEPTVTNDGRLVIWNGGDQLEGEPGQRLLGANMVYSWNPDPASPTGWSPPKNVAYMYYVEGPGAGAGEVQIALDGVPTPFSDVFPIARQPFVDQQGVPYDPGTTYLPAEDLGNGHVFPATATNGAYDYYVGSYPWISWDGRNLMHKGRHSFNMTVIGELTGYRQFTVDSAIDQADRLEASGQHEVQAVWNLGHWPGKWAQLAGELEGRPRTVPINQRDAATWVLFEQDHYSELSFHRTDGSYALFLPMSRMQIREANLQSAYRPGVTPDVSGSFNTGALVPAGGAAAFSQSFSDNGYETTPPTSRHFGFSGNSVGFLTDAGAPGVEPHIRADAVSELGSALTVEGAVYLRTGGTLPAAPWTAIVRQPGSFELGVNEEQRAYAEVIDRDGVRLRVVGPGPVPTDAWAHVAARYDGEGLALFVDGQQVAGIENVGTGAAVAPADGADVFIGPKNRDAQPGGNGLVFVDEVGITRGLRTDDELAHNAFRTPRPVESISLAAWEAVWGAGAMPLGFTDAEGALLAPIYLGYPASEGFAARAALGEMMFRDPVLSHTAVQISCETCHSLAAQDIGARAGEVISTQGAGPLLRNTPTVFNRVFATRQFWDGRAGSLGAQSTIPIASGVEMAMPLERLTEVVLPNAGYGAAFADAFGDSDITVPRVQEAFASYESALIAGDSAIDRHRFRGDPLPDDVARGMALFATKARCIGCHPPPLYTDGRFHDTGQGVSADTGRARITSRPGDIRAFRTMSLRDVDRTAPYMHDGSVPTLREVVENYNAGGVRPPRPAMRPLGLTSEEIDDLVAFLRALRSNTTVVPLE